MTAHAYPSLTITPVDPADREALRRQLGLDPDAVLIGCFGRVRAQKGVDLLVQAV